MKLIRQTSLFKRDGARLLIYEIDLQSYERSLADDAFETGLEDFIEAKPSLQDQLITLFPEIPAPRPTPTPDPSGSGA